MTGAFFDVSTAPPDPLRDALLDMIRSRDYATPRHRQVELGPSDVSHPCMRKTAFASMREPETNPPFDPLASIIGTAMHSWLQSAAELANQILGRERWLTETRVPVTPTLAGSSDLFDTDTGTVIDWKGLELSTPLPTPDGWTTMGDIQAGQTVFDSDGQPVKVLAASEIWLGRKCFEVTFEDGATIVCDDNHEWNVLWGQDSIEKTMNVVEMRAKLRDPKGCSQIRIANTSALYLPDADLPIEPYLLGAWIGDGHASSGRLSKSDELFGIIESRGGVLGARSADGRTGVVTRTVQGLNTALHNASLRGNKHIPAQYLRASRDQRLWLLRGLMDTDGTMNVIRNQASFTTIDRVLANQVAELVSTLGWKPRIWELNKTGFGKTITAFDVTFTPTDANPFALPHKAERVQLRNAARSRRRVITSIEPVPSVATRCIMVDSPTSTFLCGREMIPTHNTASTTRLRKYRKDPGPAYRGQVHLYARGFENLGHQVNRVAIAFIPRGATLHSFHVWSAEYDPRVADAVLARRNQTLALIDDLQVEKYPERYAWIPAEAYDCEFCPFFSARPTSPFQCKGDGT